MRRIVFVSSGKPEQVIWNVGIDFPNGIRDLLQFQEKITSPGIPDTLAFHSPKGINDIMILDLLLWLLEEDVRRGYVWLPVSLVFDLTAVDNEALAERMCVLLREHFMHKQQALGLPFNFIA